MTPVFDTGNIGSNPVSATFWYRSSEVEYRTVYAKVRGSIPLGTATNGEAKQVSLQAGEWLKATNNFLFEL